MDPEKRLTLQVTVVDVTRTEEAFQTLMGKDAAATSSFGGKCRVCEKPDRCVTYQVSA